MWGLSERMLNLETKWRTATARRQRAARGVCSRQRRAFSLLEAVLALALMVLMFAGVYGFYFTSLKARETGTTLARDVLLARALLDRMASEIRQTVRIVPGDGIGFQGTQDKITIVTSRLPENYAFHRFNPETEQLPPAQLDIKRITYELLWDEEEVDDEGVALCHGMWRTEQKTFDPNPSFVSGNSDDPLDDDPEEQQPVHKPIDAELIAPEIKYLKFEYFTGNKWIDRWKVAADPVGAPDGEPDLGDLIGGQSSSPGYQLPVAVRITLGKVRMDPEDDMFDIKKQREREGIEMLQEHHDDRFTIVVSLKLADPLGSRAEGVRHKDTENQLQ